MTDLKFLRRLSHSVENKASVITIPRPIALAWEQYDAVELIFDGSHLIIMPAEESKHPFGDEDA